MIRLINGVLGLDCLLARLVKRRSCRFDGLPLSCCRVSGNRGSKVCLRVLEILFGALFLSAGVIHPLKERRIDDPP